MNCLKGYIGIIGCGAPEPPVPDLPTEEIPLPEQDVFSGLYINQLPGISLKSIEKLADEEQENYLGVWKDVEARALLKFGLAFKGRLNTSHSINKKTIVNCLVCTNKQSFALALWYLMGAEMMIERTSTDRLNRYTTGLDREKAEELKVEFYGEYLTAFENGFSSMDVSGSDCIGDECVDCNGSNISFVEAML